MKVLVLAPHPFYQERGTPIAVDLLLRALSERGDEVDLLTFHEGKDRSHRGLRITRIRPFPRVSRLRPGFSVKKLYCDLFLFFRFIRMVRKKRYDAVHAVEESAFMALLVCPLLSIPFVYDVDSSMTTQLVDRLALLRPLEGLLRFLESLPMRFATAVAPMCDSLAKEAARYRDSDIFLLRDVSLLDQSNPEALSDLRAEFGISGRIAMYIGNLEPYQGIDLLLEGTAPVIGRMPDLHLVIIGGIPGHIARYREIADRLGIGANVRFTGPRPVEQIGQYMAQADILVSPRVQGQNTPMKIYSYLDSGVAVLATRLPTHTQVLNDDIAMLAAPRAEAFAAAMETLLEDPPLRRRLAAHAREHVRSHHSYAAFRAQVDRLYARLGEAAGQ